MNLDAERRGLTLPHPGAGRAAAAAGGLRLLHVRDRRPACSRSRCRCCCCSACVKFDPRVRAPRADREARRPAVARCDARAIPRAPRARDAFAPACARRRSVFMTVPLIYGATLRPEMAADPMNDNAFRHPQVRDATDAHAAADARADGRPRDHAGHGRECADASAAAGTRDRSTAATSPRPEVDAFRELRTRLLCGRRRQFRHPGGAGAAHGSGGSFVARNLAAAFAFDTSKSALLIDCDLRHPSQHKTMRIAARRRRPDRIPRGPRHRCRRRDLRHRRRAPAPDAGGHLARDRCASISPRCACGCCWIRCAAAIPAAT